MKKGYRESAFLLLDDRSVVLVCFKLSLRRKYCNVRDIDERATFKNIGNTVQHFNPKRTRDASTLRRFLVAENLYLFPQLNIICQPTSFDIISNEKFISEFSPFRERRRFRERIINFISTLTPRLNVCFIVQP